MTSETYSIFVATRTTW